MKHELADDDVRKIYEEFLNKIGNYFKKLIIATDLKEVIQHIDNSKNRAQILEVIPTIVQGIDLNNFTDVNRFFEFPQRLPKVNQLKLTRKVLSEMRKSSQYEHVFHVICQITLLRNSINRGGWMVTEINFLSKIVEEIPYQLRLLLLNKNTWQIKGLFEDTFLYSSASKKYNSKTYYFLILNRTVG